MVVVNYKYRKIYAKYILVYIKIKIVKTLKYELSCIYEIPYSHSYWRTCNLFLDH
jgi:hypothetical protein